MDILTKIKKYSSRFFGTYKIAVDFGSSNIRIGIYDKGITLREPSFIGLNTRTMEYLFFGEEAKQIYGKAPNFINVIKPIAGAVISDFDSTVLLIQHFMDKAVIPYFGKGRILRIRLFALSATPTSSTEVEQKASQESLLKTGATEVQIVEKPIATAYGADLPVFSNSPSFVVDMGGGLIEMAVLISGGIVGYKTIKIAGDHMDKLIGNYLHLKYGILVGEQTCESLKIKLFSLADEAKLLTVRGKSLENGLPKSVRVKSNDIKEALVSNLNQIIDNIKELLESVPPEIIDGIVRGGITLTGGLANIPSIDKYMTAELKVAVNIAKNPQDATINGLLKLLGNPDKLQRTLIKYT